jgi:hypothetical protein
MQLKHNVLSIESIVHFFLRGRFSKFVSVNCFCRLWEGRTIPGHEELFLMMVADVAHKESALRSAAAEALAVAVKEHKNFLPKTLDSLLDLYAEKNHVSTSVLI